MQNVFCFQPPGGCEYLDDGCNELFQETVFEQGRPVMMDEVDQQAFDMGAILILSQQ